MKLTAVLYSVLIFISCANNAVKDNQKEKTTSKYSNPKGVEVEKETTTKTDSETTVVEVFHEEQSIPTPINNDEKSENLNANSKILPEEIVVVTPTSAISKIEEVAETQEAATTQIMDLQEEIQEVPTSENVVKVPSHSAWEALLQKYVDNSGNVDYGAFRSSKTELAAYLEVLAKNEPQADWSKNEKLAYYINLYNAATVKLILDNYPTNSIKDIKKPWGKDIVTIGDAMVSLGYIEHKVLRKMNEPRIHFAINCASYSCPKLVNKAFTAAGMEQQLEAATKDFVNDTTRNQFSPEEAKLSEIFKWYKGDFTVEGSLKEYINNYLATPMTASTKIKYLKYNWNLNEK